MILNVGSDEYCILFIVVISSPLRRDY